MASFLGDVKTLKKKVQGFESNTDAVERPPYHLYFHPAHPNHTAGSTQSPGPPSVSYIVDSKDTGMTKKPA